MDLDYEVATSGRHQLNLHCIRLQSAEKLLLEMLRLPLSLPLLPQPLLQTQLQKYFTHMWAHSFHQHMPNCLAMQLIDLTASDPTS